LYKCWCDSVACLMSVLLTLYVLCVAVLKGTWSHAVDILLLLLLHLLVHCRCTTGCHATVSSQTCRMRNRFVHCAPVYFSVL
jgi:hypothetical protein